MKVLVGYASAHGSTAEIAMFMGRLLEAYGVDVTVTPITEVEPSDPYDVYIVGSAIHAGMWLRELSLFFERAGAALVGKPSYLFITCIRTLEDGGLEHAREYYVHHPTLEQVGISMDHVGVLAGKIDINSITWDERWLLASNYDGTEASKLVNHDYRDWQGIAAWIHGIAKELKLTPKFA